MNRYFTRLAQRTGMLDPDAPGRQTVTAPVPASVPVQGDVAEIRQQTVSPVVGQEHPPNHNLDTETAEAGRSQVDASGVTHSFDHPSPEQATASLALPNMSYQSDIVESEKQASTNNTLEKQAAKYPDVESKRSYPEHTQSLRYRGYEHIAEHVNTDNRDERKTVDPLPGDRVTSHINTDSVPSTDIGPIQHTLPTQQGSLSNESSRAEHSDTAKKWQARDAATPGGAQGVSQTVSATDIMSIRSLATVMSDHDDRTASADFVRGMSYISPSSKSHKLSSQTSHQNIDIHIGSITMEVHQKQPAVATITSRPKSTDGASVRPTGQSTGFRPSRYYLRGV